MFLGGAASPHTLPPYPCATVSPRHARPCTPLRAPHVISTAPYPPPYSPIPRQPRPPKTSPPACTLLQAAGGAAPPPTPPVYLPHHHLGPRAGGCATGACSNRAQPPARTPPLFAQRPSHTCGRQARLPRRPRGAPTWRPALFFQPAQQRYAAVPPGSLVALPSAPLPARSSPLAAPRSLLLCRVYFRPRICPPPLTLTQH